MEVVPAMSDASPFQRRDVAEWTHRDRLTGVVETARVETDRWAASSATAKHAYGKVVDSRNRSLPDGSAHQRQRQQLEVFQTKGPGGSLQVIRTQTVTSTNSSTSWRGGGGGSAGPRTTALAAITQDFEDLPLSLNPLNLSSEKSKASVGRSGSISSRRPPSRPRSLVGKAAVTRVCQDPPTPVTRTCQAAIASSGEVVASRDVSDHSSTRSSKSSTVTLNGHLGVSRKKSSSIEDLHNGASEETDDGDDGLKRSSKVRRSLQFPLKKLEARGGVCKLLQELEESSKRNASEGRIARRSFEALENVLKRNNSLTDSSNLSERDDGENRCGPEGVTTHAEGETSDHHTHHSVNSVSIDDFARRFNSSRSKFILEKRHSLMDTLDKGFHDDDDNEDEKSPAGETKNLSKRHSFVTVESLKEVRGRLKRLNSPLDGLDTESGMEESEDHDDGIGTEETSKPTGSSVTEIPQLRVKSYVYGIEGISRSPRPPVLGTGSLESRTSNKASVNGSRSDEWYNRRKSYGFESVHGDDAHAKSSALLTSKYDDTNRLTSTDSGICRSSDQFAFPSSWKRKQQQEADNTKPSDTEILQVSHSIPISKANKDSTTTTLATSRENVRKGRTTVVTFGSKPGTQDTYNHKEVATVHRNGDAERTQTAACTANKTEERSRVLGSQPVTVSIPVLPDESSPSVVSRRLFFQQLSQGSSVSVEKPWNQQITKNENQSPSLIGSRKIDGDDWWRNSQKHTSGYSVNGRVGNEDWQASSKLSNSVMKRHSIAVDSSWKSFSNLNKSVHENLLPGATDPGKDCYRTSQNPEESKRHSIAVDKLNYLHDDADAVSAYVQQPREDADNSVSRKQKRVEFCKTEVHFAAEPGRINIVETDEKPPPNNMFRRRRRHSTPASDAAKNASNLPEVRFGDSVYEKQLLGGTEEMEGAAGGVARVPVLPVRVREELHPETNCAVDTNAVDEDDEYCNYESSLEPTPRSILKNHKKPKPYLIGENEDGYTSIEEQKEEKWGVRLRPVAQEQAVPWRTASTPPSRDEVMPAEYSGQSELQKLLRSLRPANSNRAKAGVLYPQSQKREDCSVAERVRQVEQVASESKGFSTRVNFGAGEATVVDEQTPDPGCHAANQRLYKVSDYPKPVWQRREEAMVTRDASKLKVTEHEMQMERNGRVSSLSHFLAELPTPQAEVGLPRGGKTTTITIDLSLPPSCNETHQSGYHVSGVHKLNAREVLLSPSLIMRTIQNPGHPNDLETTRNYASPSSSVGSLQEMTQSFASRLEDRVNGFSFQSQHTESRRFINTKEHEYCPEYKVNTREQTSRCYQKSWMGGGHARGDAEGQRSRGRLEVCAVNGHGGEREDAEEVVAVNQVDAWRDLYSDVASDMSDVASDLRGEDAEEVVVVNQLDAWRALYCDVASDLSDDSEKADEEVRSYMSVEGDVVGSEVSGSWSRATGLRHLRATEGATGNPASECPDEAPARPQQRSVATATLPAYNDDCDRLRAVETLVSTRSGQPKITSISLRYGEDNAASPPRQPVSTRNTESFKFTSKTSISAERTSSSTNVLGSENKSMPSAYLKSSYTPQSYPLSSKITPTVQSYPLSSKVTPTTHSYPLSSKATPTSQSYPLSSKVTTTSQSYPLSSKVTPTSQSYPLSSKVTPTSQSYPLSSKVTPTPHSYPLSSKVTPPSQSYPLSSKVTPTPHSYPLSSKVTPPSQSYPLSSKVTPAPEKTVSVSRTRLDGSVEKNQSHTNERKTLFDRSDVTTSSQLEPERRAVVKHTTTQSETPSRGLSFSHFDKKPLNVQKSNSPTSKPLTSCQAPTDALTTSEVSSERSAFAKQLLHSEPTSRTATVSSVDKYTSSKVSSSSVSKQSSNHTTTTTLQNSPSLINPKTITSYERRVSNPSNSPLRSQSPRNSSFSSQHGEGSDKPASPCHRSSPRSRGVSESQGSAKLDTSSSSSRVQRRDSKEKTRAPVEPHTSEPTEIPPGVLGKTDRLTSDAASPVVSHTTKTTLVGRESRRVTRSTSKSPTPTKKVTPPSKNSKTKDFIGRVGTDSPTYQNGKNSTSPSNTLCHVQSSSSVATRCEEQNSQFPVYQNRGMFHDEPLEISNLSNRPEQKRYDCGLDLVETDSAILEELTRAADQILQAVNGYTDEESRRASSDDDNRRPRERRSTTLGTISEASPLRRAGDVGRETTSAHRTNGNARRAQRVSSKTKLGPTSSTSSVESFTRETRRAAVKTERSGGAATSSRTARMVQRANSRELLLLTNASSSEDVASGTESKKQRAPPPRRSRASSGSNKDPSSSSTRSKDKLKDGLDSSRTKERVSTSRGKSRDTSDSRESRRKVPETKHHPVKEKTIPAASGLTGGRERAPHARHSTSSTRATKTPNHQEKASSSSKRRNESAVQT